MEPEKIKIAVEGLRQFGRCLQPALQPIVEQLCETMRKELAEMPSAPEPTEAEIVFRVQNYESCLRERDEARTMLETARAEVVNLRRIVELERADNEQFRNDIMALRKMRADELAASGRENDELKTLLANGGQKRRYVIWAYGRTGPNGHEIKVCRCECQTAQDAAEQEKRVRNGSDVFPESVRLVEL